MLQGMLVIGADDNAVWTHEVLDRRAFLEEFRIRDNAELDGDAAPFEFRRDFLTNLVGSSDGHRRFVDDDLVFLHVLADVPRGGEDVNEIGRSVLPRGGSNGDQLEFAVIHRHLNVGCESKVAGRFAPLYHGLQAGFVDGDNAPV